MLACPKNLSRWRTYKLHVGVAALVLILHAALFYALWRIRADSLPAAEPVFVDMVHDSDRTDPISPETAKKRYGSKAGPAHMAAISPSPVPAPMSAAIVAPIEIASVAGPAETIAPAASASAGAPQAKMTDPTKEAIGEFSNVSLVCPVRTAPVYPLGARKRGETGKVLLRVELDETGRMVASDVAMSSGFFRLDEAAVAAVKSWRCKPAIRDGQALRIVSMESFDFTLGD